MQDGLASAEEECLLIKSTISMPLTVPDLVIRWKDSDSFSVILDKKDSERVLSVSSPECHTSPAVSLSEEIKPCRLSLRGTGVAGTARKGHKAENKADNGLELMAYKP